LDLLQLEADDDEDTNPVVTEMNFEGFERDVEEEEEEAQQHDRVGQE